MSESNVDHLDTSAEDAPPILGTWQRLYTVVLVFHFLLISLFYWFTTTYA